MNTSNGSIDVTGCSSEPIHIPGSIQPHGFLLALDERRIVRLASESTATYLRCDLPSILGQPLDKILQDDGDRLLAIIGDTQPGSAAKYLSTFQIQTSEDLKSMEVVFFRSGSYLVLEFEETRQALDNEQLSDKLYRMVSGLEVLPSIEELSKSLVQNLQILTGFDRVLLYCFDETDGNGTVLAEARNERLPSYLHLHFPGSDIPQQARRLYAQNRVRIIPNVAYVPSELRGADATVAATLDLSNSILRSVSPVHREYMRNMGTASSMSISILIENRLWGLVSFHHKDPFFVPFRLRTYCDMLTQVYSAQLTSVVRQQTMSGTLQKKEIQRQLLTSTATEPDYIQALSEHPEELLKLVDATGVVLLSEDRCIRMGVAPTEDEISDLSEWLPTKLNRGLYATNQLSAEYTPAEKWADVGAGILALSLSQIHHSFLVWFRPELIRTIQWAGEPSKIVVNENGTTNLHPRNSFALWTETVRNRSKAWSSVELETAAELRHAIIEVVLKRAEEMAELVTELEFTNKELEAFSYSVSHDLRAPFRHISGFSELLLEEESEKLSEKGRYYIRTIMSSAQFAGLLVDTLLNFSRIARSEMTLSVVDMNQLAAEQWQVASAEESKQRNIEFLVDELPSVVGDVLLLRQVLKNLFSNALKYTRPRAQAKIEMRCEATEREVIFSLKDNGVGFNQNYAHKLFGVFQRLHRAEEFEGTGIGLANIRRIILRHGGRTWAEGEVDAGATFYFSLPKRDIYSLKDNDAKANSIG